MSPPSTSLADLVRRARAAVPGATPPDGELRRIAEFGANPGALDMLEYVPDGLAPGAPLVVALHGCTQNAAAYAAGSGWAELARRHGFALLLPEQRDANNPRRCLNWFEPGDTARGAGEAASIRAMVGDMVARHRLDPARLHVTGLSAGGAMATTLLAAYPDVFAAGAIIAGLPHGAATNVQEAFEAMATGRPRPAAAWAALVRGASPHRGPWPRVSIWQGSADPVVRPANADALVAQWTAVHGLAGPPAPLPTAGDWHRHHAWRDGAGQVVLERHDIDGMGHGVPLAPGLGMPGAHFLEVGVASTPAIAAFFGLMPAEAVTQASRSPIGQVIQVARDGTSRIARAVQAAEETGGPGAVIRRALRAAGLLRD